MKYSLFFPVPPKTTAEATVYATLDDHLDIICVVTSQPAPTVKWYSGNRLFNGEMSRTTAIDVNVYESRLVLHSIEDRHFGTYRCEARNLLGKSEKEIIVKRKSRVNVFLIHVYKGIDPIHTRDLWTY